jgi:hypothetical protein
VGFDFLSAPEDGNVWKMDGWTMTNAIGVDGFFLSATYPQTNYGSDQWKWGKTARGDRRLTGSRLFHSYEQHTPPGEIDGDLRLILDARQRAAEAAKSRWAAAAANLALRPGLILELGHFYGMKDRELITSLVTGITLRHRTRWPSYLAVRLEGAGEERTEVQGECVDWGDSAEKRCCPNREV